MNSIADIKIYNIKKKELIEEKAILIKNNEGKILCLGNECEEFIRINEANTQDIKILSPFKLGIINEYFDSEKLLKFFVSKYGEKKIFGVNKGLIFVHEEYNEIDKKAIEDVMYQCGFKYVFYMDESVQGIPEGISWEEVIWQFCEKEKINMAIEIEKNNKTEYAKEAFDELNNRCKHWGVNIEDIR